MNLFKLLIVAYLATVISPSIADALPSQPYISVSGISKIQVKPDTVKISFQATATENSAESAKLIVDKQIQLLLSKLKENGFKESLLNRGNIQLRPEYEMIQKKQTQVGIKATRNLSYQLGDTSDTNLLLELLVEVDIANIGQFYYSLKQPDEWQQKARNLAVQDSINKAQQLAKSYHAGLGKVYSIRYQSNNSQPIMMRSVENSNATALYQENQITINERVDTIFLLEP